MPDDPEPQPEFTIEPMTPETVEAATRMRLESWLETYVNEAEGVTREWIEARNAAQLTPEKQRQRQERLASPNSTGWVAKDAQGNIVGMAGAFLEADGTQHLGSLYVTKDWQGRGVAGALTRKVIDWSDPTKPLVLGVVTYNRRAQAFYRKWGFEEIPNSRVLFDNKIPEIKMIRKGDQQ